ncbi:hypothetical protein [Candidatus Stoquefichus sp. SB1]|jgi:hypothetical protein|uniref:hypothetical protein n=1 Tax=Candidatus Stoquefichus sp. SB1 TaxID=1658109 RepID=UPI00067EFF56|nr:hypothetical protein [Candidatus Stoquefichus sp. SB1]
MDTQLHIQQGPTCGVYSLAYALHKLDIKVIPDDSELQGWAQCVAFDNEINKGCNPVALTHFINSQTSFLDGLTATLYANVDGLCANASAEIQQLLKTLQGYARVQLDNLYINEDYNYKNLKEGQICIGIFVSGRYNEDDVKVPFVKQFAENAAALHYMMIEKMDGQCVVYDSNVGERKEFVIQDNVANGYAYSGLAIVLEQK